MALCDNKDLVQKAFSLDRQGHTKQHIAKALGICRTSVRKLLNPRFEAAERIRLAAFEKTRYPVRKDDPRFIEYQARYNDSDRHRERSRAFMRRNRRLAAKSGEAP